LADIIGRIGEQNKIYIPQRLSSSDFTDEPLARDDWPSGVKEAAGKDFCLSRSNDPFAKWHCVPEHIRTKYEYSNTSCGYRRVVVQVK